jgi:hypothetical protein
MFICLFCLFVGFMMVSSLMVMSVCRLWDNFTKCFSFLWKKSLPRNLLLKNIQGVPDFGSVFIMVKYTDITQNTYVQSWTVTDKRSGRPGVSDEYVETIRASPYKFHTPSFASRVSL